MIIEKDLDYDKLEALFEGMADVDKVRIFHHLREHYVNDEFESIRHAWQEAITRPHTFIDNFRWEINGDPGVQLHLYGTERKSYDQEYIQDVKLNMSLNTALNEESRKAFFLDLKARMDWAIKVKAEQAKAEELSRKRAELERLKKELGEE